MRVPQGDGTEVSARCCAAPARMLVTSALISGLGLGSMYGLLALGFHVTHAVSNTVNFAQGSTMMLGAVLCFTFWVTFQWPLTLAVIAALALSALWGAVVERVAVRPFVQRGSNAWLLATVALGIVLENVVLFTFGKDPRGMPPGVLTTNSVSVAGIRIQFMQILIPIVGLMLAAGLHVFFHRSRYGKALLAVVQNKDAARLMGIDVERVVMASFALSGFLAGIAGILVAPLFTLSSTMGTLFGIKAFAVAILGGIGNAWGVVLAGLVYGIAEAQIIALLGSTYSQIVTFALVILALALRPNGLFGRAEVKKV
jgi:branched-chain amino acid transport system permease protein